MSTTPAESTLTHHVVTALRSGGYGLRDRVVVPPRNYPIHILDYDLYDTDGLSDFTGASVELKPGCYVFSQEKDELAQWDAHNLTSVWLFEGRQDFWDNMLKTGVSEPGDDKKCLLGFIADSNGLLKWSFTVPRVMTANSATEIVSVYADASFTPDPEQKMHMFVDMQMIGMLVGHLAADRPPISNELGNFMKQGFAPLLDEMMGLHVATPIPFVREPGLLEVPDTVRAHVDRAFGDRIPKFPYQYMAPGVKMAICGVLHADQERVLVEAQNNPLARAKIDPGCWVLAPLDPLDTWPPHDLMAFTFVKMTEQYWDTHPDLRPHEFMLCVVSNIGGPRMWFYHVPCEFDIHLPSVSADAVTDFDIDLSDHREVIDMDLAVIARIGLLNQAKHKFLHWGECSIAPMEAETPVNWMANILNHRAPRGH